MVSVDPRIDQRALVPREGEDEVVVKYQDLVYKQCSKLRGICSPNGFEFNDLLAVGKARLVRAWRTFDGTASFMTWAYIVVREGLYEFVRESRRGLGTNRRGTFFTLYSSDVDVPGHEDATFNDLYIDERSWEEISDVHDDHGTYELSELWQRCLPYLSYEDRLCAVLRTLGDGILDSDLMTLKEISQHVGCSESRVFQRLQRVADVVEDVRSANTTKYEKLRPPGEVEEIGRRVQEYVRDMLTKRSDNYAERREASRKRFLDAMLKVGERLDLVSKETLEYRCRGLSIADAAVEACITNSGMAQRFMRLTKKLRSLGIQIEDVRQKQPPPIEQVPTDFESRGDSGIVGVPISKHYEIPSEPGPIVPTTSGDRPVEVKFTWPAFDSSWDPKVQLEWLCCTKELLLANSDVTHFDGFSSQDAKIPLTLR